MKGRRRSDGATKHEATNGEQWVRFADSCQPAAVSFQSEDPPPCSPPLARGDVFAATPACDGFVLRFAAVCCSLLAVSQSGAGRLTSTTQRTNESIRCKLYAIRQRRVLRGAKWVRFALAPIHHTTQRHDERGLVLRLERRWRDGTPVAIRIVARDSRPRSGGAKWVRFALAPIHHNDTTARRSPVVKEPTSRANPHAGCRNTYRAARTAGRLRRGTRIVDDG